MTGRHSIPEWKWEGQLELESEGGPEDEWEDEWEGEPFCCEIEYDQRSSEGPEIGDRVLVKQHHGMQFIAPVLAIKEQRTDFEGRNYMLVVTDNPPWITETRGATLARMEAEAIEKVRLIEVRKIAGLCPACGEEGLENCACIRQARTMAKAMETQKRKKAEAAKKKAVRDQALREADARYEEHNRQADDRRAGLTADVVKAAIEETKGQIGVASRNLGVEKYTRTLGWDPRTRTKRKHYSNKPTTRFLVTWVQKHAPELMQLSKAIRAEKERKTMEAQAKEAKERGACPVCYRPLSLEGHCPRGPPTYGRSGPPKGQHQHQSERDKIATKERKRLYLAAMNDHQKESQ